MKEVMFLCDFSTRYAPVNRGQKASSGRTVCAGELWVPPRSFPFPTRSWKSGECGDEDAKGSSQQRADGHGGAICPLASTLLEGELVSAPRARGPVIRALQAVGDGALPARDPVEAVPWLAFQANLTAARLTPRAAAQVALCEGNTGAF